MELNKETIKKILDDIDLSAGPPEEEPARQYYFMASARRRLREQFAEDIASGEALKRYGAEELAAMEAEGVCGTAAVITFGCQMNAKDAEKFRGILECIEYKMRESEDADLILYNTCTVRENANLKVYGHLGQAGGWKKRHPKTIVGLCGCMMQEPDEVERIKKSYPFVDLIFGTHNVFKLAELVDGCLARRREAVSTGRKQKMLVDVWEGTDQIVEDLPADRKYPFKSGVNIMFGCNNFCSYCIVPYVRGRERSRRPEEILAEVRRLADEGVAEVMLLGQNVNSYGKTLEQPMTFAKLLKEVEQVEGIRRIRFMTSHPKDLSDELIQVMAESEKICRHLHLPLQSGSSRILKAMNRRYTKEQFLALAEKIKKAVSGISLTTDIIVGFPGETEEDFLDTMDVVDRVGFDSAFTFIYSKRTGTPAAAMEDQVPEDVVKERFDRLLALVQKRAADLCGRDVGTVQDVLVEEVSDHDPGYVTGRLSNNTVVHFPGGPELVGKIVDVYLEESRGFYYMGRQK